MSNALITSEQAVLGAVLIDPERLPLLPDPSSFISQQHRLITAAITDCSSRSEPIDIITVAACLEQRGELDKVGGLAYLVQLHEAAVPANAKAHVRIMKNAAVVRALISAASDVHLIATSSLDAQEKVDRAQQRLMSVSARGDADIAPIELMVDAARHVIALRAEGQIHGLLTYLPSIDSLVHGFKKGDLIVVAGRPSMGKSALSVQFIEQWCRKGVPAMLMSLEMSAQQVIDRMCAHEANLSLEDVLQARSRRIHTALESISEWPLVLDEQGGLSAFQVAAKARQAKTQKGIEVLIIDYLQLMAGKGDNRNAEIEQTTRALKALAKELQIPVVVLSQLSRKCEERPNHRPMLSDLRDSGSIEQDADVVLAVYREEAYRTEPGEWRGLAEVLVLKNRQGATGTARLKWDGDRVLFSPPPGQWPGTESRLPSRRKPFDFA
ncbi:MAG: replicative DNA helicase [Rhodocyclaceae bacterium]|nr:replicative DNA helicase [Rhodocyclaceae bacterium]